MARLPENAEGKYVPVDEHPRDFKFPAEGSTPTFKEEPDPNKYVLDTSDPFEKCLIEMLKLNRAKRHDYAGDDDPWQNFYDTAVQVNDTAGKSVELLIATKQARLKQLLFNNREPKNESVRDTILDRAVYSVIALSIFDRGDYTKPEPIGKIKVRK